MIDVVRMAQLPRRLRVHSRWYGTNDWSAIKQIAFVQCLHTQLDKSPGRRQWNIAMERDERVTVSRNPCRSLPTPIMNKPICSLTIHDHFAYYLFQITSSRWTRIRIKRETGFVLLSSAISLEYPPFRVSLSLLSIKTIAKLVI